MLCVEIIATVSDQMRYPKDMTLEEKISYYEERISRLSPPRHRSDLCRIEFYRKQLEQIKGMRRNSGP